MIRSLIDKKVRADYNFQHFTFSQHTHTHAQTQVYTHTCANENADKHTHAHIKESCYEAYNYYSMEVKAYF